MKHKLLAVALLTCLTPLPLQAHHHGSNHHQEDCKNCKHAKDCKCKQCTKKS